MDFQQNEVHANLDQFWPVEHPIEPLEEDQPAKYPIPHASAMKANEEKEEQFFSETLRRKAKLLEVIDQKDMVVERERPRRAVRRRHQTRNKMENTASSSLVTMSPLYPFPPSNNTNFHKLGHFN